ncbi:MAG: nucleotidyltransferase domain-containing protein [Chrysiogenales bacterium]
MVKEKSEVLKTIRKLLKLLKKNGICISESYLFGSYARNEAKEGSDIDLALISDDFCGIRFIDIKKIALFIQDIDDRIEAHTFSNKDKDESLFLSEIISKGIRVA